MVRYILAKRSKQQIIGGQMDWDIILIIIYKIVFFGMLSKNMDGTTLNMR